MESSGVGRRAVSVSSILYLRHNRRLYSNVRTCRLHERPVEAEGEKRLLEAPQEVLEQAGDGVDVVHLAEHGHTFAAQELLLQLPDGAIGTRQTVQSSLTEERTQPLSTLLKVYSASGEKKRGTN